MKQPNLTLQLTFLYPTYINLKLYSTPTPQQLLCPGLRQSLNLVMFCNRFQKYMISEIPIYGCRKFAMYPVILLSQYSCLHLIIMKWKKPFPSENHIPYRVSCQSDIYPLSRLHFARVGNRQLCLADDSPRIFRHNRKYFIPCRNVLILLPHFIIRQDSICRCGEQVCQFPIVDTDL